ncbi:MAG: FKBP-type peptidyl-prolyl cis-trans isomerase [Candidatus Saccharimonadales bacterium]
MKEFMRRGGWVFLGLIIVGSALAGGIYSVIAGGSNSSTNNYINCPTKSVTTQKPGSNGKYQGAKLVNFTPVKHIDYLQCQDLKVGTGSTATATSTITATYTGALANSGVIFQSSLDTGQPFTAQLGSGVIQGWTAGLPGMKVGGTRRLLIPAQYAYGAQSVAGIPPNSDLVFDITLLAVK